MTNGTTYRMGVRVDGDTSGLARAAAQGQQLLQRFGGTAVREFQRMAQAREQLGMRSEQRIRREIAATEAAYNRLVRSGTASFNDQQRAAERMRQEVTRLTNEMGRLTKEQQQQERIALRQQRLERYQRRFQSMMSTAVGLGVAGAAFKPKLDRAMDYDQRLRVVANTGVDVGASQADREAQRKAAEQAVLVANRYGGGNRDDALDAFNEMISKGSTFTGALPQQLLPEVMRAATATSSAATDFAKIAAAGIQNFGMGRSADEAKAWFNIAAIGGKLGGFEVRQQAQYLPEIMAGAGNIGMRGKTDFANLVALNQAVEKTAGTPDKAATNVKQFLTDLGSDHFRQRAQKASGVNFTKFAAENRLRGVGMIDSAMQLIDRDMAKHPAYQRLQREAAAPGTSAARKADLESAMKMIEGSIIAKYFHNQESLQAVSAYRTNRGLVKDMQQQALSGRDEIGASFGFMASGASYKANQLTVENANAMQQAMEKLLPKFGSMADSASQVIREFPLLSTGATVAGTSLMFLAGKLGWLYLMMGKGAAAPAAAAATGAAAAETAAVGAGGLASRAGGMLAKGGAVLAGLWAFKDVFYTSPEEIAILEEAERKRKQAQADAGKLGLSPEGQSKPATGNPTTPLPLLEQELRGQIDIHVTAAPGLNVTTDTRTNAPRIPFKADAGRSMTGTGY